MTLPLRLSAVALSLGLAACASERAEPASATGADSVAADPARADSLAAWEARFGGRVARPDSVRIIDP